MRIVRFKPDIRKTLLVVVLCVLAVFCVIPIGEFVIRHNPFDTRRFILRLDIEDVPLPRNNRTDYNILILIPFSERVPRMKEYLTLLSTLTYPRDRISIGIGQKRGYNEKLNAAVRNTVGEFQHLFKEIKCHVYDQYSSPWTTSDNDSDTDGRLRTEHKIASERRNELLFKALRAQHQWVVWMDADLKYFPSNLIELLLSPSKPITIPTCVSKSINNDSSRPNDHLITSTGDAGDVPRAVLAHEIAGGDCVLLINASTHRQGLVFPPFPFPFDSPVKSSRGIAKMANQMGIPIYGLPAKVHVYGSKNMTNII